MADSLFSFFVPTAGTHRWSMMARTPAAYFFDHRGDAWANHSSRRKATVPSVAACWPLSTSTRSARSALRASRSVPRTDLDFHRFLWVTGSRPA